MRRALPLLLLCACALREPRVDVRPCSSSLQCESAAVCFLGECRPHSSALSLVAAEVRPPNDSALGVLRQANIDLQESAVRNFTLATPLTAAGTVAQAQDTTAAVAAVPDALVTFTEHAPAIPDRVEQVTARTDSSGNYTARLAQGLWDVVVQPPPPLPPYRPPTVSTDSPQLVFVLPSVSSLPRLQGGVTIVDGGAPLPGADVTAVDSAGVALSSPSQTQADGGFSLVLPPGASGYTLHLGPPPDADGGTPLPNYDKLVASPTVTIDLPPLATLQGVVLDSGGIPVAAARVYARSDGMPWTLMRSTTAGSDGSYSLNLRAGTYVVEAAPPTTANAGVSAPVETTLTSAPAQPLLITCPDKVQGYGLVTRPDFSPVGANFQITATRLADRLLTTRTALTTPTDSNGTWHIIADPGVYRVEIVPTADSGLPRKVVQLDLSTTGAGQILLPSIAMSPPLLVAGTVQGPSAAVANATVSFFALDTQGHGVLLGAAPTDASGHYRVILPDVAQPGVVADY